MSLPLCFVLIPFGRKPSPEGLVIDFDQVYRQLIAPAIEAAELEPLRPDKEEVDGFTQKPMFERLSLCEFAVADLTLANPQAFYELGIRHAAHPWRTVLLMAEGGRLPIDVHALRTLFYKLDTQGAPDPQHLATVKEQLIDLLRVARNGINDSPIYQLLDYFPAPKIGHEKTDIFREQAHYSPAIKDKLMTARGQGTEAVRQIEHELGQMTNQEAGVIIDLLLSYRATRGWKDMITLVDKMPPPLRETVLVQEQYALALNRDGQQERAEKVLLDLIAKRGASSETYSILGRVYKDRWEEALRQKNTILARGLLGKAIDAYLHGFEADWRDAYPGINAVTLMELKEPPDPRRARLIPVVAYAIEQRIATSQPDYWDYATGLELAVLASDEQQAVTALGNALAAVREAWEPETTARNLRLIREAREQRGAVVPWMTEVEQALVQRAKA
jgi:hypothetical protein